MRIRSRDDTSRNNAPRKKTRRKQRIPLRRDSGSGSSDLIQTNNDNGWARGVRRTTPRKWIKKIAEDTGLETEVVREVTNALLRELELRVLSGEAVFIQVGTLHPYREVRRRHNVWTQEVELFDRWLLKIRQSPATRKKYSWALAR